MGRLQKLTGVFTEMTMKWISRSRLDAFGKHQLPAVLTIFLLFAHTSIEAATVVLARPVPLRAETIAQLKQSRAANNAHSYFILH